MILRSHWVPANRRARNWFSNHIGPLPDHASIPRQPKTDLLLGEGPSKNVFVAPDVQGSNHHRFSRHEIENIVVNRNLIFDVEEFSSIQVEELGAEQTDFFSPHLQGLDRITDPADVRGNLNLAAIHRRGRLVGFGELPSPGGLPCRFLFLGQFQFVEVGPKMIEPSPPSKTVSTSFSSSSISNEAPTTAGTPMLRARIAVCEVGPPLAMQIPKILSRSKPTVSDGVRSMATDDRRLSQEDRVFVGFPLQTPQYTFGHIRQVLCPRLEVRVVHVGQRVRVLVISGLDRSLGIGMFVEDRCPDLGHEFNVIQECLVGSKDISFVGANRLAGFGLDPLKLVTG